MNINDEIEIKGFTEAYCLPSIKERVLKKYKIPIKELFENDKYAISITFSEILN
jgi:hypothetical protein